MKLLLVPLVLTLLLESSIACSCIPAPPPLERAGRASAVFIGRIKAESTAGESLNYEIEVLEVFTGKVSGIVRVSTASDGAACGTRFDMGGEYLVFCSANAEGKLRTGLCSYNRGSGSEIGIKEIGELRAAKGVKKPDKPAEATPPPVKTDSPPAERK